MPNSKDKLTAAERSSASEAANRLLAALGWQSGGLVSAVIEIVGQRDALLAACKEWVESFDTMMAGVDDEEIRCARFACHGERVRRTKNAIAKAEKENDRVKSEHTPADDVCTCGHTGAKHRSTMYEDGHGDCEVCPCLQFTWKSFTPEYESRRSDDANHAGRGPAHG